jgi:hypothetical protein
MMNEVTVLVLSVASIALIGFVLFVLWLRLAPETRLVLFGIAVAVFAAWCGALSGGGAVRISPGPPAGAAGVTGDVPGGLLKFATVLALGGVALAVLHRGVGPQPHPSPSPPLERPRDATPNV